MGIASRKLRVLVASEPGLAGVKRHVVDYLREIDLQNFDILLAYSLVRQEPLYRDELQQLAARGIRLHEMRMTGPVSPGRDIPALLDAVRLIRREKPDILHAHSSKAGFLFRLAARLCRSPAQVIYTPHAMACYFSNFFQRIEQLAAKWTHLFIAVSPSEKEDLVRWQIAGASRIATLTMGVHPGPPSAQPAQPPVITACGRLCYQKNSLLFFQAMELVAQSHPEVRFRWIGSFSNDAESRAVEDLLVRSPHRHRFEITGWSSHPETYLAEAAIFCMLSRYEAFGYVTADAMRLGIPVVGLDVTGTKDLVRHRVTGLIVPSQPAAVAEAVQLLLERKDLRQALGHAGREVIMQNHTVARMTAQIETLYRELAAGPG